MRFCLYICPLLTNMYNLPLLFLNYSDGAVNRPICFPCIAPRPARPVDHHARSDSRAAPPPSCATSPPAPPVCIRFRIPAPVSVRKNAIAPNTIAYITNMFTTTNAIVEVTRTTSREGARTTSRKGASGWKLTRWTSTWLNIRVPGCVCLAITIVFCQRGPLSFFDILLHQQCPFIS